MLFLASLDLRTLLACDCMLSLILGFVFVAMHRLYPQVPGVRTMAIGFLLLIPATILVVLRGHVPTLLSITLANLLLLSAAICKYEAVSAFLGTPSRRNVLWVAVLGAECIVFYYSEVRSDIVPRIVAVNLALALIRGFMCWPLLRSSRRKAQRNTLRFFGVFMGLIAAFVLMQACITLKIGAPANLLERNALQAASFILGTVYMAVSGLAFLALAGNDLVLRTRLESHLDPLTGTLNRRGLEATLSAELRLAQQESDPLSVGMLDVDFFKTINDQYGHPAGDAALQHIAGTIGMHLRTADALGRFGGDEFLFILPRTAWPDALVVAERYARAIAHSGQPNGLPQLTLSIGITQGSASDTPADLIARADRALYKAKTGGRDAIRVFLAPEHQAVAFGSTPSLARLFPHNGETASHAPTPPR